VLGQENTQKDWISADILNKIKEKKKNKNAVNNCRTRTYKTRAKAVYANANRESIR